MNGQNPPLKSMVPLPGGAMAAFTSTGEYFYHPDHLGSSRLISDTNRNIRYDGAYAPFGETYANSGSTDPAFTGQRQDTVSGLYDFPAREYSYQGRWPSPDPAGLPAVDPTNPQSWNRYAYVMNNPLALIDPTGMNDCPDDKPTCGDDPGTDTGAAGVDLFGGSPSGGDLSGLINLMDNPAAIISVTVVGFLTDSISLGDMLNGSWGPNGPLHAGGNSSWVVTFAKEFFGNFSLKGARLPGETRGACFDRSQKALLGDTGQSVLNNVTGAATVTSLFTQPLGATSAFAGNPAGKSVVGKLVQVGLDSGATDVATGYQFARGAAVVGKVAGVVTAIGAGIEFGFAISCR